MKPWHSFHAVLLFTAILVTFDPRPVCAADGSPGNRSQLYDTAADAKEQITVALKTTKAENKRVILKCGANWCGWRHKLSGLLMTNAELAQLVKDNYVLPLLPWKVRRLTARDVRFHPARNRRCWMRSLADNDPVTRATRVCPLKMYFTGAS